MCQLTAVRNFLAWALAGPLNRFGLNGVAAAGPVAVARRKGEAAPFQGAAAPCCLRPSRTRAESSVADVPIRVAQAQRHLAMATLHPLILGACGTSYFFSG